MMDLNEISFFVQVVQSGSFSKAALQLNIPKSTISHKVASLEKRLGITLIQRTTRQQNITSAGRAYYEKCVQALEEIKTAESALSASQSEPQGMLRITAPAELGGTVLPEIISKYTHQFPRVEVELLLTDRQVDLLSEKVDLAIRVGQLKDSSLRAKKVGSVYFAPFASPEYLKSRSHPLQPKDLKSHDVLRFTPLAQELQRMTGPRGSVPITFHSRVAANSLEIIRNLAVQGEGIAFLPTYYCYPEVKEGRLIRLLGEWKTAVNPVHFVSPAQKYPRPLLSAFMSLAIHDLRPIFDRFEL